MKKSIIALAAVAASLISCNNDPIPTDVFVRQDMIGEWTVQSIAYDGTMPNPLNPSATMGFNGLATQLNGSVNLYEMPDTGNIDISFVAAINTLQVPVELVSSGEWYLTHSDSVLVLDNDSVSYEFVMDSGLPTTQVWKTSFTHIPADSSYWADINLLLTLIK